MKITKYLSVLAVAVSCLTVAATSFATTSTVNPNVPAQNAPLSSAVLRGNFAAVVNDINALWAAVASAANSITGLTGDVTCSGSGSVSCALSNTTTARADIGLPLGTSGAVVGLLNGNNTYSGSMNFTALDKHNLNAGSLPSAQTGTILQLGNADGTAGRVELDAFGAAGHYSVVTYGGTAASPTALIASTTAPVGSFNVFGYNGTSVVGPQAAVRAYATQPWSVGSNGTQLDFAVTPNGSSTLTQAFAINQDGGLTSASVTGGDKGIGTINVAGCYVNGVACVTGNGGVAMLQPSSYYTSDTAGNIFPNVYTGSGGNASASDAGWGVAASLSSDVVLQMRFQMPPTIPSIGTFKLVSYCLANYTGSNSALYTVSDSNVAAGASPSAATLATEAQNMLTPWVADQYLVTKTPLSHSTPTNDGVSVVAITFNHTSWTLAQIMTCRFVELWE